MSFSEIVERNRRQEYVINYKGEKQNGIKNENQRYGKRLCNFRFEGGGVDATL